MGWIREGRWRRQAIRVVGWWGRKPRDGQEPQGELFKVKTIRWSVAFGTLRYRLSEQSAHLSTLQSKVTIPFSTFCPFSTLLKSSLHLPP